MHFLKSFTVNGVTLNFVRVRSIEVDPASQALTAMLQCWPSEADYIAGNPPAWVVPQTALLSDESMLSLQSVLLTTEMLDGAAVIVDPGSSLAAAQQRKWAAIKIERDAHEFGLLTWDGSAFDADERAQARIQGAVQMATLAAAAGEAFAMDWTLADNSVRTMSAADMVALGQALAQQVLVAHETARSLRLQIEAAVSLEEVEAVSWPT